MAGKRRLPLWLKVVLWAFGLAALAWFWAAVYVYEYQGSMLFDPDGRVVPLAEVALERSEVVSVPVGGGLSVQGWYVAPKDGFPVILYLKDASGSVTAEHGRFADMAADGYGLLAVDYRGFPFSPGQISQANMNDDALAAYDYAASRGRPVVIWGRGLGAAPATWVAAHRDAGALILESPLASAVQLLQQRFPILPVSVLLKDKFPTSDWIGQASEPLFLAHGAQDAAIPESQGEELYALAPNPRLKWIAEGAGHDDLWQRGLWTHAKAFLAATAL
ncbi:MAG TPA: alpha/beta hydrolase [Devosiaceae bacterium]